jgi:predicted DsbA family dithiol-disulfide isomerase
VNVFRLSFDEKNKPVEIFHNRGALRARSSFCLSWLILSLGGCAGLIGSSSAAKTGASASQGLVLGQVNGRSVTLGGLGPETTLKLAEAENEYLQRRLHLMWRGFEEAVDEWVLAQAAEKEGITVSELRVKNLNVPDARVSQEEVKAFYEEKKAQIEAPFARVAPAIERQLTIERTQQVEQKWLSGLRAEAEISYSLPVPILPRQDIDHANAPALGPENAPVTIVEFSDFQCPYCTRARDVLKQLVEDYPQDLKVVYRDFPLGQHARAKPAAAAAQCAHEQERFWPYHDALFDHPEKLEDADLLIYAEDMGLDKDKFVKCLASERPERAVDAHIAAAQRLGVNGTPALFINGVKLIGLLPLPLMRALIDKELELR